MSDFPSEKLFPENLTAMQIPSTQESPSSHRYLAQQTILLKGYFLAYGNSVASSSSMIFESLLLNVYLLEDTLSPSNYSKSGTTHVTSRTHAYKSVCMYVCMHITVKDCTT